MLRRAGIASLAAAVFSAAAFAAAPSLTSIALTPSATSLPIGASQSFAATGYYSDGSSGTLPSGMGAWTRGPALPMARVGASAAYVNGRLYVIGANPASLQVYDPATAAWSALTAPPVGRYYASAAAIGGKIYVLGGCVNGDCNSTTAAMWVYDTGTDAWTSKASLPAARLGMTTDVIGGKIYAAGGYAAGGPASAALTVYDPAADAWTTKASMPAARGFGGGGAAGGKLYFAGGESSGLNQVPALQVDNMAYDPATDSWTLRSPLPDKRGWPGAAAADGRIYLLDGSNLSTSGVQGVHGTLVYDPAADAWSSGPATNDPRTSPAIAAGDGKLFVAGSLAGNIASSSFEFVSTGLVWSTDAPSVATVTAAGLATGVSAGVAHIAASNGGVTGTAALTVTVPPTLTSISVSPSSASVLPGATRSFAATGSYSDGSSRPLDGGLGAWGRGPDLPLPKIYSAAAMAGGRYYVIGGDPPAPSMHVYDPAIRAWKTLAPPPVWRAFAQATAVGTKIYVFGGCINSDCSFLASDNWAYDTAADTWTQKASMPAPRQGMSGGEIGGKIYAAGGFSGGAFTNYTPYAALTVYDPATDSWSTKAAMPQARGYGGVGVVNGILYYAGGSVKGIGGAPLTDVTAYDPAADSWTARAPLPVPLITQGGAALGGKLYIVGGGTSAAVNPVSAGTWAYDPASNSWHAGPALNDPRYFPMTAADGATLYVTGSTSSVQSASFESATLNPSASWSTDAPSVATVTAAGLATGISAGAAHVTASIGAVSGSAALTVSAPGLSGAALGASSVAWSWALAPGATGYHVLDSSGADKSGALGASTTVWIETGLTPNAAAARRLEAVGASSAPYLSILASRYTWAAPPAATAATSVFVSSASLAWSLNGNPPATLAAVEDAAFSTAAPVFVAAGTTTALSFDVAGLAACTTYYFRVRNFNAEGVATAYDAIVTARTRAAAPLPPGGLTAAAQPGARVLLAWSASPTPSVSAYRLYLGTGAVDYSSPYAVLASSAVQFLTPALSTSATYRFGLRAFSECGGEEANVSVAASATPLLDTTGLSAAIKVPQSGKRVSGNRVTVMAEIVSGDPARVRDVLFQYRTAASTSAPWLDIPATDAQHPNPAPKAPYFVHWDVTGLADGSYELRAVATATDGAADPAPGSVVIGVNSVDHDTDESLVGGSQKKDETVYGGAQRTVSLADDGSGAVAEVTLPTGVISAATDTLSVQINPPGAPLAPKLESAGQTLQITLGSGQTSLNGAASITMHYADADGDGIVDGTQLRVDRLAIYSYYVAGGVWRKESASVVDKTAKTITATTPHFSLFGLFATASADLSNVRVYPVPWVPGDADAENGKPYSASDATSGIVFDGLTDAVRVQVFSVSGSLVWESRTGASGGKIQWDGRNSAGRDAASGGYIAVITDLGSGAKVVRKLAIIR